MICRSPVVMDDSMTILGLKEPWWLGDPSWVKEIPMYSPYSHHISIIYSPYNHHIFPTLVPPWFFSNHHLPSGLAAVKFRQVMWKVFVEASGSKCRTSRGEQQTINVCVSMQTKVLGYGCHRNPKGRNHERFLCANKSHLVINLMGK